MRSFLRQLDVRVSFIYGIVAILWIIVSDGVMVLLYGEDVSRLATISLVKGLSYVLVTSLALYGILRAELRKRDRAERELQEDIAKRTQTMAALQQSEIRFASIFHGSPVSTSIARLSDGYIVDVNDATCELFGYTRDEMIGHTTLELGLWADPVGRSDLVKAITEQGRLHNLEVEALTRSGARIVLLMSIEQILLDDVPHLVAMSYDLTEQRKIEEQRRYQAALLGHVSDAVISIDNDLKIRSWNPAAEAIYGWTADEVTGRNIREVLQGDFQDVSTEEVGQHFRTQGMWRGEIKERRKDGSTVDVLASMSFITDSAGERIGYVSVNKDITERKRMEQALRESEQRFRTMADTAPAMLWTSDASGLVTFLSHGWYVSTGQTEASGLGWGWLNALHPDDRDVVKNIYLDVTGKRTTFQVEYRMRRSGRNDYRWVIASGTPRYNDQGEFLGFIGSVIDVTERKQAQEELQAAELLRMELEKEKELLQLKERFISIVSHEFRTPLSVIVFSAELMYQYYDRMPRDRQVKHVREILAQGQFMVGLLDDVLTVNKARSGKLEFNPQPLDVVAFCETTLERLQVVDQGRHHFVFTYEGELSHVVLDEKLLQHILVNLLGNAVKYSPNGGDVRLQVTRLNGEVIFRVSDQGIGIPQASLARLFEPFYRAENIGDISGTGLGTAIIKDSVDLHKGTIVCESEVGVGTTFTVKLPTAYARSANGQA
ncbi:MAG: PAS domain S-box protein [Anaerolineae bacterium]|nr:PAS domain S-box protein [Anaerolineae bacterium]